ncbi:hypothetical protein TD95_004699 [Thielaviopsis punctulata]|uniref:Chromatin modification-related protein n=1 Tax=Thielaviopsis punctulata TaxID=72032 RepID=A0A0F4Z8E5_9PEZI|nr:hypothetical protein TD95_004699 [Thielaviopsis punctulata]
MPRDDLSIDFVKKMPQSEPLDPAVILDEWFNRVQNLPEEVRFIQDEIADKDRQYAECIRIAEDRDAKIQKWIKNQGSHEPNPREDQLRLQVRDSYSRADKIATEKVALTNRLQTIMDKHLRSLDLQIKLLYDRAEPGFLEPNEVPSLLRPSPANKTAPSLSLRTATGLASAGLPSAIATGVAATTAAQSPTTSRASTSQIRNAQSAHQLAASAPVSPAASIILNRNQRESSAGAAGQKRPRINSGASASAVSSSSLARHSSLGPASVSKNAAALSIGPSGTARPTSGGAGGPRASSVKASGNGGGAGGRKAGTPSGGAGRKKAGGAGGNPKSSLLRVRKSTKTSPASTGDSELSDADSGSDMSDHDGASGAAAASVGMSGRSGAGTPVDGGAGRGGSSASGVGSGSAGFAAAGSAGSTHDGVVVHGAGASGADGHVDVDEEMGDYDESGDNKKYCLCQKVSFGDMVACDNDDCPYEWFHWSCVGLESEPNGTWYCPVCDAKKRK